MTKELEKLVRESLVYARTALRVGLRLGETGVGELIERTCKQVRETYLSRRTRGRAVKKPETLARYEAELAEACATVDSELRKMHLDLKRKHDIALIEYPLLSAKLKAGMARKQIPYRFETDVDRNKLTVQVTGEYFLEFPVTIENVDEIIGKMRYFLNRPDCAAEEVPGVRRLRNYHLAGVWKKIASS